MQFIAGGLDGSSKAVLQILWLLIITLPVHRYVGRVQGEVNEKLVTTRVIRYTSLEGTYANQNTRLQVLFIKEKQTMYPFSNYG